MEQSETNQQTEEKNKTTKVENKAKQSSKFRRRMILIFAFVVLLVGYVLFRGSFLEVSELGENYVQAFWQKLAYEGITFGINFVILFFLIYFTNRGIKKGLSEFFVQEKKEMPRLPNKSICFILAILISAMVMVPLAKQGMLAFSNTQFVISDPIFNQDIGYYFFQKPFIEAILFYLIILAVGLTIYTAIYYIIVFNVYFDGVDRQTLKRSRLIRQMIQSVKVIVILIAGLVFIKTQDILFDKMITLQDEDSTAIYGAGITDVTIKLWGYRILCIVMIVSVFLAIKYFKQQKTKKIILSLLTVPAYLVALFIIMSFFQFIFVRPNELDKEKEYIAYNIENTKNAYNINIEEKNIENTGTITTDQLEKHEDVINNIAIVDKNITLSTLQDKQTSSKYYVYRDTQIGKYDVQGKMQLVYLSPREIAIGNNVTYNNKTYEYTHGMSAVITSATSTDNTGNLQYIQKSFDSSDNKLEIKQPRIYFGMETNEPVVTNSKNKSEFDYPTSETENATNDYTGQAGLKLNFWDRLILGIRQGNLKLAFSSEVTDESKILINRNILKRVEKVMPYIIYDEKPYQVITQDGKLVWVIDGYTISDDYPYSQTTIIERNGKKQKINYIRNSVKVIIDSYDGTMKFYITDRTDPIIMAYRNLFPTLFQNVEEAIPEEIAKHIVYPEFLYKIQASMLERYHTVKTDVLYRNNDVWEVATHNTSKTLKTTGTPIEPYYTMIKTIDKEVSQLGLVLPFTMYERQSLISYLVATCDENINGKLTLYRYSADSNVLGPMQLDTQIEQDEEISKAIQSLSVTGTKIIRNMIMIPINDTIVYIEPIYQVMLNESEVPILKKVIVASGNKVAIGNNVAQALDNLISQSAINIEVSNTDTEKDLIHSIVKANENLQKSQSSGDWEMIGKDMKTLQDLIVKLEELLQKQEKEQKQNQNNTADNNSAIDNNKNTNEQNQTNRF